MPGLDSRPRMKGWLVRGQPVTKKQAKEAEKETAERIAKEMHKNGIKKEAE